MGIKTFTSKTDNDTNEEKDDKQRKNVTIQGFWVELLNPKSALFFLAFLPQFTNKSLGNVDTQLIILSLTVIVLGFISDAMYALMAGHIGNSLKKSSHFRRIEKYLSGSIFCSLGILGLCYKLAKK